VRPHAERREAAKPPTAGCVLGPNSTAEPRSAAEVSPGSKGQAPAEGGCRLLKAPLFVVASWWVQQPCRMQGRLRVMPLALLVYAGAPRRLRRE
jgi:hypothetical protein